MTFEHFAINLEKPHEFRDWYCEHIGLKVVWEMKEHPFMTFLADDTNRVICEIYYRPDAEIIDYKKQHHLTFHFAFESENAENDKDRLLAAGATFVEEVKKEDGSHLVMLRDPWGLSLQLCQRTIKFNQ